jgi:hypothetical protein
MSTQVVDMTLIPRHGRNSSPGFGGLSQIKYVRRPEPGPQCRQLVAPQPENNRVQREKKNCGGGIAV